MDDSFPSLKDQSSDTENYRDKLRNKRPASESPEVTEKTEIDSIRIKKKNKKDKISEVMVNPNNLQSTLDKISSKLESVWKKCEEIPSISNKIDLLNISLEKLQQQTDLVEKKQDEAARNISWLYGEMSAVQVELNQVRQATLTNDLVIQGIPTDLLSTHPQETFRTIASALGIAIDMKDIKYITERKHKPSKTSRLFVSLHNGILKQNLMNNFKTNKPFLVEKIYSNVPENSTLYGKEIKIFNQLTSTNKQILAAAYRANNGKYKYIWEKSGRILMKENDVSKTNLINCRYCKGMIEETMQHVIASCDAHSSVRRRILNHTVINAEELAEVDLEDFLLFMRSDPPSSTSSADSEIREMAVLNYLRVGRKSFVPTSPKLIPQHKLEVWPGYVIIIIRSRTGTYRPYRNHHQMTKAFEGNGHKWHTNEANCPLPGYVKAVSEQEGGLMLELDVSHRVLSLVQFLTQSLKLLKLDEINYRIT
ncbi:CLUMA_CG020038, isoform A [Clunio marinus]|uniref:CLUMA_CG020038, isoform A n=1 Tax=Clunio marinus TaxID=568069 RepID=A0A1J1J6C1_9DIPT|nr:CLUMA_CG020038, isoform A [Clunio marinus]